MRRLLAVSALALAAFASTAPANANVTCAGVYAADNTAGVCAGSRCADTCDLTAYPTCHLGTIGAACAFQPL